MLINSRHHQLLCRMALFAMLMLFVGPLISQTQQLMAETASAGTHQGHAGHEHHAASQPPVAHQHQGTQSERLAAGLASVSGHHDLSACGYCTLGVHLPGLSVAVSIPDALPPMTHVPWKLRPQQAWTAPFHLRPGPRAPPSSFVVSG